MPENVDPKNEENVDPADLAADLQRRANEDPKPDAEPEKKEPPKAPESKPELKDDDLRAVNAINAFNQKQRQVWTELKKQFPDVDQFRDAIEDELSTDGYGPAHRLNPKLIEKIYWMNKGKESAKSGAGPGRSSGRPADDPRVVSRRVAHPGADAGMSGAGGGTGEEKPVLSEDEQAILRAFPDVTEEDYEKSKKARRSINVFRPKETGIPQGANAADMALHRMKRK